MEKVTKIHQSIYMPLDLRKQLESIAAEVGVSTNSLIVTALREYVRDNPIFRLERDTRKTKPTKE